MMEFKLLSGLVELELIFAVHEQNHKNLARVHELMKIRSY